MSDLAVLTAVGPDRAGLVHDLSQLILERGCNIEDSRMALLGGEFAMILLVAGEAGCISQLLAEAPGAGDALGLTLTGRPTEAPAAGTGLVPYDLRAYSMDHPGIVERLTRILADRDVNIRALDTHVTHAPHSGQPLFSMRATVELPGDRHIRELRKALEVVGDEENIDVEITPAQQ